MRPLREGETAFISINNINASHQSTAFLPKHANFSNEIEFIYDDLEYTLDIKLLRRGQPIGGMIIPEWDVQKGQLSTSPQVRFYAISTVQSPKDNDEFIKIWQDLIMQRSGEFKPSFR